MATDVSLNTHDALAGFAAQILREQADRLPFLDDLTLLLPTAQAAPRLRRLLLDGAAARGHEALLGARILSLQQWLAEIPLAHAVISPPARELLLVEALRAHRHLFGHANLWSLAESLLGLFDELTLNRVGLPATLDEFEAQLARAYGLGERTFSALGLEARVVFTLWRAWQEQLTARALIDAPTAILLRLTAGLERLRQGRCYLLDFIPAHRAEADWLAALPASVRVLEAPPFGADTPYTRFLGQSLLLQDPPLAARARAFAAAQARSPARDRLHIFSAASAEQEARAVVLQVRRALLEGAREVAIVSENRRLARRVRALLERAGIGVCDAAGWPLSTTSAASALERWLQCAEEDFPHQAMLDLLKSPFVSIGTDRDAHLNDVYHLEEGIILQGQTGRGLDNYRRALRARARLLPEGMAGALARIGRLLDVLEHAATPLRLLMRRAQRPDRLFGALQESLERLGLAARLAEDEAGVRLLHELARLAAAVDEDSEPLAWSEFRTWLGHTLERQNFHPAFDDDRVQLMGLEQGRLGCYDALIIAGAEREYLPGADGASPFFNEAVRHELGLPGQAQRRQHRQEDFLRLLQAAPRITLTLREREGDEAIQPSPWLESLRVFHRLAWNENLDDPAIVAWVDDPRSEPWRCDTDALPAPVTLPRPALPPNLIPKNLSASGYQQLVDCPYQFFAARGLKLAPPEEIRDRLAKADYGEYVHRSLQAFHHGLDGLPGPFVHALTADTRAAAIALLDEIARAVFAEDIAGNLLERTWLLQWQRVIPACIDWEIEHQAEGWRTRRAELELQRADWLPELGLRGRVDRVDRNGEAIGIIDYKTGGIAKVEDVFDGEAVQLPFYALLYDAPVQRAAYLALGGERGVHDRIRLEGEDLDALVEAQAARLRTVFAQLHAGAGLPAWGDEARCRWCEMAGLCRREARGEMAE